MSGREHAQRRAAAGMSASFGQRPPPKSPELLTAEMGLSSAPAGKGLGGRRETAVKEGVKGYSNQGDLGWI